LRIGRGSRFRERDEHRFGNARNADGIRTLVAKRLYVFRTIGWRPLQVSQRAEFVFDTNVRDREGSPV
jgi:hypothetical protein